MQALVKMATAIVSVVTAIALWRLLPQALALPSPAQLQAVNIALRESEERFHQAQKMEAVGQLTGGIAHDFNNMLQSIAGGLDLTERAINEGHPERAGRFLDIARKSADRAASLTHRLLAFARRQSLQPVPVVPGKLIRGMEGLIRQTMGPEIDVRLRLPESAWTPLCDPNQLESALLNLTINARDAMPEGGALIIATANRSLSKADLAGQDDCDPGDYVEIAVTDTGTGMSPDVLTHVFEPFFTTKPTGQGTGLGLPQVFGFVRQSGGFVRMDSQLGRGTTARIYLPRCDIATIENDERRTAAPGRHAMEAMHTAALVVEDEPDIRGMISKALHEMGCEVIEAANGIAGLQVLQTSRRVDLLITDVGLPGMNGRQLADAARTARPGLPVLMITGYAGKALDDLKLEPGMEILRKPFALDALAARVQALLRPYPLTDAATI